jgi:lysophospholipase L1-like esterase
MAAGLTALLAALLLALGWRARVVALCLTPLLLAGTLTGVELHAWAETARVLWLPTPWLSALIPAILCGAALAGTGLVQALREGAPDWSRLAPLLTGLPLAGAGALESGPLPALAGAGAGVVGAMASGWLLIRLGCLLGSSSPVRSAAILNGVGSLMALGIALTDPLGPAALAYAHALGVVGGALFWVNANPRTARAYNFTAFALALAVLGCLEVTVRFTTAGQTWAGVRSGPMAFDVFSELETAKQEFSIFDAGRPTAYPSAGYPVRLPARTGAIRVIATGSSSTGGAYQNDRLSDFYPARMQEALGPGYQVINQGVGGWTTFHIDGYVTARIESLDPDVLILYVGHNDQLTALPRPIKEIYSRVHDPGPGAQVAARLAQFRLYQGLRYTVASLRPPDQRVAVPLDHARENLSHIISLMKDRGGRVVLASEGLSPDPGPLVPYFQMLQSLAEAHSEVIFVDTAAALHQQSAASVFLDDSHLTDRGHRLVAAMLAEAIAGEPTK